MNYSKNKKGSALFIVLGCVALMTLLVVAFLGSSIAERSSANSFAKEVNSKLLAENAINLCLSQLRTATKSTDANGHTVAWASQPGMIRTYGTDGNPDTYFKLYSWSNMVGTGAYPPAGGADTPDATWTSEPDLFTDLNEAVNSVNPIIATQDAKGNPLQSMTIAGHTSVLTYTSVSGTADIEGFYVDPATTNPWGSSNQVPMPVMWIYILKDGTQVAPSANGTGGVTVTGASATNPIVGRIAFWTDDECSKININTASEGSSWDTPTTWATEDMGTYDSNGISIYPYGMATAIPAGGEYQRVPGHPATTSLSTVFSSILPIPTPPLVEKGSSTSYDSLLAPYYMLTPRYAPGGSKAGTRPSYNASDSNYDSGTGAGGLVPPSYRLYASLDEIMFDPYRLPLATTIDGSIYLDNGSNGISPGTAGRPAMAGMTQGFLNETQFFLTANSKAPEETLFETPRISLWPIQTDVSHARNVKDNLLAFCATINKNPYYFQRAGFFASSVSGSYNPGGPAGSAYGSSQDMAIDMGGSTSSSGAVTPGSPSATTTYTNDPVPTKRNQNLLAYLRALTSADGTSRPIPGFGGTFLAKYPQVSGAAASDLDQILVDMFDFIRSNVNTYSLGYNPQYSFTPIPVSGNLLGTAGAGSALPIQVTIPGGNTISGLGRNPTIAEVTLVFMPAGFLDQTTLGVTGTTVNLPMGTTTGSAVTYLPTAGPDGLPDDVLGYQSVTTGSGTSAMTSGTYVYDGYGDPQTNKMQAFILIRPYNPSPSVSSVNPNLRFSVAGLDKWTVNLSGGSNGLVGGTTVNLGFPSGGSLPGIGAAGTNAGSLAVNLMNTTTYPSRAALMWGILPWVAAITDINYSTHRKQGTSNGDITTANQQVYPLAGTPISFPVAANPSIYGGPNGTAALRSATAYPPNTFSFSGGNIAITVSSGYPTAGATAPVVQTINMNFPAISSLPIPSYARTDPNEYGYGSGVDGGLNNVIPYKSGTFYTNQRNIEFYTQVHFAVDPAVYTDYDNVAAQSAPYPDKGNIGDLAERLGDQGVTGTTVNSSGTTVNTYGYNSNMIIQRGDTVRSLVLNPNSKIHGDIRLVANMSVVPLQMPGDSQYIYTYLGTNAAKTSQGYPIYNANAAYNDQFTSLHSLVYDFGNGYGYWQRPVAMLWTGNPTSFTSPSLTGTAPVSWLSFSSPQHGATGQGVYGGSLFTSSGTLETYCTGNQPGVTPELAGAFMDTAQTIPGDWTSGIGNSPDGPMIMTPDEGYQAAKGVINSSTYTSGYYMTQGGIVAGGNSTYAAESFSPNRQIASGVIFGTLPATVQSGQPWRTLLFCPNPEAASAHPGFGKGSGTAGPTDVAPYTLPPDYLFLDLFWMPIIDPYAISEPFSTSGKVNMNYQIVPFTYIHRSTAVRAVLKSVGLQALPAGASQPDGGSASKPQYKSTYLHSSFITAGQNDNYRYQINLDATVDADHSPFQTRFNSGDIFRSAAEICNIFLVPQQIPGNTYTSAGSNTPPTDYNQVAAWWGNFQLTSDNEREAPYNKIYPRLTTKSNTFQVHYRVQTLVKNSTTAAGVFNTSGGDSVGGEYRGSATIERYIDPNDANLPDFAAGSNSFTTNGTTMSNYYRFRVVRSKSFNP